MSIKTTPNDLIDEKFIGIPYKFNGIGLDGADCIGLTILYLLELGVHYEYDDGKGDIMQKWWEKSPQRFLEAFHAVGKNLQFHELKKLDVLLLLGPEPSTFPSCMGIMVDDRHMLVTFEETGSHVTMLNKHWKSKFWSGIRLHKVVEAGL